MDDENRYELMILGYIEYDLDFLMAYNARMHPPGEVDANLRTPPSHFRREIYEELPTLYRLVNIYEELQLLYIYFQESP